MNKLNQQNKRRSLSTHAFTARALMALLASSTAPSDARGGGGFGGGGGGRGAMGYGGGDRGGGGDAYRGFGGGDADGYRGQGIGDAGGYRGQGGGDDGFRGGDSNRPSAFSRGYNDGDSGFGGDRSGAFGGDSHADAGQRTQAADQTYGQASRSLATDGGFGQLSGARAVGLATGDRAVTSRVSPGFGMSRAADVRRAFDHNDAFNQNWWGRYPGSWHRPWFRDRDPYWAWGWGLGGWNDYCGWWGYAYSDEPVEYDYGDNIVYQGDTVYYGSQPAATADEYYTQAQTLATSTTSRSTNDDWKPLGVFSLVQGNQTNSTALFEIAVNKDRAIAGNYYNLLTNDVKPITGAIDKKSMRAAWTVQGNKDVVYDTGFANLMKAQSAILVHFNRKKTQQFSLVRLQKPTSTSTTSK